MQKQLYFTFHTSARILITQQTNDVRNVIENATLLAENESTNKSKFDNILWLYLLTDTVESWPEFILCHRYDLQQRKNLFLDRLEIDC